MGKRVVGILLVLVLTLCDFPSFARDLRECKKYGIYMPAFSLSSGVDLNSYADYGIAIIGIGEVCFFSLAEVEADSDDVNLKEPDIYFSEYAKKINDVEWDAILPDGTPVEPYSVDKNGNAVFITPFEMTGQMTIRAFIDGELVDEFEVTVVDTDIYGEKIRGLTFCFGEPYYILKNGNLARGWFLLDGHWRYSDSNGVMQTGWQNLSYNGISNWYYFEPKTSWDGSFGKMYRGWHEIDGTWYYFQKDGSMASNEWINGYWLSASGAWKYQPKGRWRRNSKGWWYEDERGWYPKDETVKINGVSYTFDENGYLSE